MLVDLTEAGSQLFSMIHEMSQLKSRALLTYATGTHQQLLTFSLPTFKHYAKTFGYSLIVKTEISLADRPAAWAKIKALQESLQAYEEVLWLDADAIILDFSRDIREIVQKETDLALVVHNYDDHPTPNTGVMLFRRTEAALRFLEQVYAQEDLIHHPWWENAAIIRLLDFSHPFVSQSRHCNHSPIKTEYLDDQWNMIRQCPCEMVRIRHFAGDPLPLRLLSMAELVLCHPGLACVNTANPSLAALAAEVIHLEHKKMKDLETKIIDLEADLSRLRRSKSWKLTQPLRALAMNLKRLR